MTKETSQEPTFVVKQPLRLYRSKKRRYVRLDISAPMSFAVIDIDKPLEQLDPNQNDGEILNISGGGVLIACETKLREEDYVALNLELREMEILCGIAGKVKRVDEDGEDGYLVGIEFCSEEELKTEFGAVNIGSVVASFDERVKRTLLKYIFTKKVDERLAQRKKQDE